MKNYYWNNIVFVIILDSGEHMNLIFKDKTNISIYIIEQYDDPEDYSNLPEHIRQTNSEMSKFNLGRLKNIGYDLASKNHNENSYYILSDVDLLPSKELIHDYLRKPRGLTHLGTTGTRYEKHGDKRKFFLGGVVSVTKKFLKENYI